MTDCVVEMVGSPAGQPVGWCLAHGASATGRDGGRLSQCHHGRLTARDPDWLDTLTLPAGEYPAGVEARALVPPIYDTTISDPAIIHGIHTHCRRRPGAFLDVHGTFKDLRIEVPDPRRFVSVNYQAILHYVVSTTFGLKPKHLECPVCLTPQTDVGLWAVTPRRERTCEACGNTVQDSEDAVANAAVLARRLLMDRLDPPLGPPAPALAVRQHDYVNGIQFWGPEAAVIYSSPEIEAGGMHTHLYDARWEVSDPAVEDNFASLEVDGIAIDPEMARLFMAQRAIPELHQALLAMACPSCGARHFDQGPEAYAPHIEHHCAGCGVKFTVGDQPSIGNPLLEDLRRAASLAKPPLQAQIGLAAGGAEARSPS